MQSLGHTDMQVGSPPWEAHSSHLAASIIMWSSPSAMAPLGHYASQAPQLVQSSVILLATSLLLAHPALGPR